MRAKLARPNINMHPPETLWSLLARPNINMHPPGTWSLLSGITVDYQKIFGNVSNYLIKWNLKVHFFKKTSSS